MQMAQIPQRRSILFAHPLRKVWVAQSPVSRGLRHVPQNSQLLLYRLTPLLRHPLPFRQHIISYVLPLLLGHPLPDVRPFAHFLLLLRRKPIEPLPILLQPPPLLQREFARTIRFLSLIPVTLRQIILRRPVGVRILPVSILRLSPALIPTCIGIT